MIAVKCCAGWEIGRGRDLLYMRFSRREAQILVLPLFVTSAETLRVIIKGGGTSIARLLSLTRRRTILRHCCHYVS